MLATIISIFLAIAFISWIGSLAFTGDKSKNPMSISNKKWKTFLMFFISYTVIFGILYLTAK